MVLYYGTLGEVVTTEHFINLTEGAKQAKTFTYR